MNMKVTEQGADGKPRNVIGSLDELKNAEASQDPLAYKKPVKKEQPVTTEVPVTDQQQVETVVQPQTETKVLPTDPDYVLLEDLPSGFVPYSFDSIQIRRFKVKDLKLIAKANINNELEYLLQAINNCIDVDVMDLTIPDFYYLLFWERMESYTKNPLSLSWTCDNVIKDVTEEEKEQGREPELCGNKNFEQIRNTRLKVKYLSETPFDARTFNSQLDFPRVASLLEVTQMGTIEESGVDVEDVYYFLEAAQWIKAGNTIKEKLAILEDADMDLYEDAMAAAKELNFGIEEEVQTVCHKCKHRSTSQLKVDGPSFFLE